MTDRWNLTPLRRGATYRVVEAKPVTPIEYEYETHERRKGRLIEATYPAQLINVVVTHRWDDEKGTWWGSASSHSILINPATGEQYKSGWRSEDIRSTLGAVEPLLREAIDLCNPRTTITITEVPND